MAGNPFAEVEGRVIARATKDPAYRAQLLRDPKAAVEQELGSPLPAGMQVQVMQQTNDTVQLVLPPLLPTGADLEQRIVSKAMIDPAFRAALLSDPKAAIEKETGVSLPDNVRVQVVEQSKDLLNLVLPMDESSGSAELSDKELEAVAGGAGCFLTTVGKTDCWQINGACCATAVHTGGITHNNW